VPDVIVQKASVRTFDDKNLPMYNIIASYNPEQKNRILLCSHWDSRPFADHDKDKDKQTPLSLVPMMAQVVWAY